ncbi:unnamed protein product [Phytophthora fragariaefolia]|uniref:Unnamed protein product n=1 Tax=Phytophthora fragariaefolia TaxID=1490495 RepID=A0A9W6X4T8_9STRA|nr:unnamed protein product [Phytophthora fragariaefolia]
MAGSSAIGDYAQELSFLPDLTEAASTTLDYTEPHVRHPYLSVEQQDRVVKVLKRHGQIMISSGNALPPPAYGVLLKELLKPGLIAFPDSPWASPIVIVLKKNGVDIRLCIDYKMVNSLTAIMEYAMPLVADILTDMEKLKNAPMIYQRTIDNALWGFVQPRGSWSAFAEQVQKAEAADTAVNVLTTDTATLGRTRFEADRENSDILDSLSAVVNDPRGEMFASGEAD